MSEPSVEDQPTEIRVRRATQRASYDRETIDAIIDACLVAHVGTVRDGQPVVIPMFCARDGDSVLIHGAPASGAIARGRSGGVPVCLTLTLLDAVVLGRSAFHHSMNYRSVVIIGEAIEITDEAEKLAAFDTFVEALAPGRSTALRPPLLKEIRGTSVLRVSLETASAKVRTGPPVDEEDDYALDLWAGIIPTSVVLGDPEPCPRLAPGTPVPPHVTALANTTR